MQDLPHYPAADDIAKYIQDYAKHFKLEDRCRLGVRIRHLDRSEDKSQWAIDFTEKSKDSREYFDRVVVATGAFHKPYIPKIDGLEHFKGQILSAQGFKE